MTIIDPTPAIAGATPMTVSSGWGHPSAPQPAIVPRVGEYDALNAPLHAIAETLDDVETVRIATANRLRALTVDGALPVQLAGTEAVLDQIAAAEKAIVKELERAMRAHPLGPWIETNKGLGLKTVGRALAAIGNPWFNHADDRPRRGPAELWAYCGFHVLPTSSQHIGDAHTPLAAGGEPFRHPTDQTLRDPQSANVGGVAAHRAKGERANWNATARKRLWICAKAVEKLPRGTDGYRTLYDTARAHENGRVHDVACPQCGICDTCGQPPGKNKLDHAETGCTNRKVRHAEPGDPLKDGHRQARAVRKVAKAILADMWCEARDWHTG